MGILRKWGIPVLLLAGLGVLVWYGIQRRKKFEKDHVYIELRAIQVPGGWGYDIYYDHRLYIHQDIIPDFPGKRVFRSKEDALTVGQVVYNRVLKREFPAVSQAEIRKLNVYIPDSVSSR